MRDPLTPGPSHVENWLDRMFNLHMIADECDGDTMSPEYYQAAVRAHDASGGAVEAATWWM